MRATTVINSRRWRQSLAGRYRDFVLFQIPAAIVAEAVIESNTKRQVVIRLSTGRILEGFCSITSGTEVYIPAAFREALRGAEWFECEIIGDELGQITDLDWAVSSQDER